MDRWEYARLEYRTTGSLGTDQYVDWRASFHHPGGVLQWGTDERYDDLPHLNRAGAAGWEAYHREVKWVNQPPRMNSVTYSMKRLVPDRPQQP